MAEHFLELDLKACFAGLKYSIGEDTMVKVVFVGFFLVLNSFFHVFSQRGQESEPSGQEVWKSDIFLLAIHAPLKNMDNLC